MSDELIERLERATEPDRELDGDISAAVKFFPLDARRGEPRWASMYWFTQGDHGTSWACPAYTASIDAAMALVPLPRIKGDGGRKVDITWDEKRKRGFALVNWDYNAQGATPAIALCIAALKARAGQ